MCLDDVCSSIKDPQCEMGHVEHRQKQETGKGNESVWCNQCTYSSIADQCGYRGDKSPTTYVIGDQDSR